MAEDIPIAPPEPAPFVPANVGRDFWRRNVEWSAFARVAVFVGTVNDRVALHWRHSGTLIDMARADAERDFWLIPLDWRMAGGRLMRPVTPEEIPS